MLRRLGGRVFALAGQFVFAIRDVFLGNSPVFRTHLRAGQPQVFLEAGKGVLVSAVLLEATVLVEDVGRILCLDKQVHQNVDSLGVVTLEAGLSGIALPRVPRFGSRGCNPE
jgi:hypothetical protein